MAQQALDDPGAHTWVSALREGRPGPGTVADLLAGLHQAGQHVDWAAVLGAGPQSRPADLPVPARALLAEPRTRRDPRRPALRHRLDPFTPAPAPVTGTWLRDLTPSTDREALGEALRSYTTIDGIIATGTLAEHVTLVQALGDAGITAPLWILHERRRDRPRPGDDLGLRPRRRPGAPRPLGAA